jgi:two-component system, OmpR family, response regulator
VRVNLEKEVHLLFDYRCMPRILLVEDEKNFGLVLRDYLRMHDLEVDWAENGEEGLQQFKAGKYDLCVLDVMMPKMDGFTLGKEIRAINGQVPLLYLTARSMKEDILKAYKSGADDYIIKPCDSEVLLLKLQAMLRRSAADMGFSQQHLFAIGVFTFDAGTRSLQKEGDVPTRLSPKEALLLQLLCEHKDRVLAREKALTLIWKESNYFTGRSMDVYITKLRKYLAPHADIKNVHGGGYVLKC